MKIVVDDKIPFLRGAVESLGQTVYLPGSAITARDVQDADALIVRTRTRCDRDLLEGSRVRFIATATIGFDHIDTAYLREAGIDWTNCPGCNAKSVAQYVESVLLVAQHEGLLRGIVSGTDQEEYAVDNGIPLAGLPEGRIGYGDHSLVMGIIGVGHVGTEVALMARKHGIKLLLCDPPRRERAQRGTPCPAPHTAISDEECTATLEDIARQADIISLHVPLVSTGTYPTFHLADDVFFQSLSRRPLFINAARGEAVDTAAILRALDTGLISACVIDTWENEPRISPELLRRAFLATPHIAGYSADGKACGTQMSLSAVARYFHLSPSFHIQPPAVSCDFRYGSGLTWKGELPRQIALYDPRADSHRLKKAPEGFERQRGDYPLRREMFS